jgi:hypothetical protein
MTILSVFVVFTDQTIIYTVLSEIPLRLGISGWHQELLMPGPVQLMDRGLYNVVRSDVVVSGHRQACSLHRYPGEHTYFTSVFIETTRTTYAGRSSPII